MIAPNRLLPACLLTLVAALGAPACQTLEEPASETADVARLVVFPAPGSALDPASEAGLGRLSVAAGVPLEYMDRAGGGYRVVTVEPVTANQVREIIRRLLDHPAVTHAAEDRRVTHQ
ncbi:hypothetical protein [Thioalkalivibrio thiocyanodenitrificans]|uniref:hypothetical protein n=1 Tax=Thioalkalivibrio thiocyanodenitrificans TaxID=243063 RepID=UPI0004772E5D|nr:hypothetical protein [Thioalkalivibrio thiocyanodenitrificans]